ncbi:glycoside hydrolase family 19 protein [Methylobacterium sp. NPDC097178]|uniref:glycoside hydrolase family 19 protein n=1 Tax=Methylobacterium TaxID=407 RepID=UPI0036F4D986
MSLINRKFFFDRVRKDLFKGSLKQGQVEGLDTLLDVWENKHSGNDDRWLAYVLGTAYHEVDRTMQPIEEYGKGKGHAYGIPDAATKKAYYGRGFVQLTWKKNYQTLGDKIGVDLVHHPEKALDTDVASEVIFTGMIDGDFTSKSLSDYFNNSDEDWIHARRIVNGLDRAEKIAGYARKFYAAISYTV